MEFDFRIFGTVCACMAVSKTDIGFEIVPVMDFIFVSTIDVRIRSVIVEFSAAKHIALYQFVGFSVDGVCKQYISAGLLDFDQMVNDC